MDARARLLYSKQIETTSQQLRLQAQNGVISWESAAYQAHEARNVIMQLVRSKGTSAGLSVAEKLKFEGHSFEDIMNKAIVLTTGKRLPMSSLSLSQKNKAYLSIIQSAGKASPLVSSLMRSISVAGKGLLIVSIALSVYNIYASKNKWRATEHEVSISAAGVAGGFAGGALAGLACGPGAPICVSVGAFLGGALSAFGVNQLW